MQRQGSKSKAQTRKPGRPAEFHRPDAVRAAMDLFWKNGFDAVSVSDLAHAMGIERSSFYNSFGDRESVFREVLDLYRGIAPDRLLLGVEEGRPVVPVVRAMFRELCRVRARDPAARGCLVVNSIGSLVGANDALGPPVAESVRAGKALFEKVLRIAVAQGELVEPGDIKATAGLFIAFLAGLNTISKVIRDEKDLWRICENFLETMDMDAARNKAHA